MKTCTRCKQPKPLTEYHKGHGKDGLGWTCKACNKEKNAKRYAANPGNFAAYYRALVKRVGAEKLRKDAKARVHRTPERLERYRAAKRAMYHKLKASGRIKQRDGAKHNAYNRLWASRNPERVKAKNKRMYAKHGHKGREWVKNNRERSLAIKKRWTVNNREKHLLRKRIMQGRRRMRAGMKPSRITIKEWARIEEFYNHSCGECGVHKSERQMHMDHYIPLSKGGKHDWTNVWPLCYSCNSKKKDKLPDGDHPPHVKAFLSKGEEKAA